MTLLAFGIKLQGELLLAFEFAVFSGRFKVFEQYHRGRAHMLFTLGRTAMMTRCATPELTIRLRLRCKL